MPDGSKPTKKRREYIDMDVAETTVRAGIAFGLFQLVPDDGPSVFELTPKGSEWLANWLDEQLSICRMWAW